MDEKKVRKVGKRKRRQEERRAWAVAILLFLCILAADFFGGFLVGCFWQKGRGGGAVPEEYAMNAVPISDTWESKVYYGGQGNTAEYGDIREQNVQDSHVGEDGGQTDSFDTQWNLMLVNQWNPIPDDYKVDLVETEGGERVDTRIYDPLMEMLEDAREANWGELPRVVSGYRTMEKQQQLYDEKIAEYRKQGYPDAQAEELARQWVAVPGHSEHQLGFAVDINGATYDVYLWLQENSYKYGFIFRYPGHKTEKTGIAEEVWHYRYVGTEAAAEIYEQGICLEEYLENMNR